MHLIGEDEVTPRGFIVNGYKRPSVTRHLARTAQEREAAEKEEAGNLKQRRVELRESLHKTNHLLETMTSKLAILKSQVHEHDSKVAELGRSCDRLVLECTETAVGNANRISEEFNSTQLSTLLQKISHSLQAKYRFVKELANHTIQDNIKPEEFRQTCWLLSRAFQNIEDKLYQAELQQILEALAEGTLEIPHQTVEQLPEPSSALVTNRLQAAWERDELVKLSHKGKALEMVLDHPVVKCLN
ncbi:hypothetical protein M408DRAFT_159871 [Serendipita vermifera MAFF 305830]|uniref:Uncharacterized protein n=1 Tax=Serendipita vermifera MAFF 305830 TaxID=933852 RepID=A0A0C3ATE3_SERVB|nr:hypothetical protein M408DRAFT_159871 [Serendipita vermifera MAFF 305830]